jgi:hypothetical protein
MEISNKNSLHYVRTGYIDILCSNNREYQANDRPPKETDKHIV